jgi:hypothetical protein
MDKTPRRQDPDFRALAALKAPFDPREVQWRVGSVNKDKTRGTALAYVEARAVMKRLDSVFGPSGWSFELRPVEGGFIGRLTVTWPSGKVTVREDAGASSDMEPLKGGASDALKRAAVSLGVGRYLYYLPTKWVDLKDGKYLAETPELPSWALPRAVSKSFVEEGEDTDASSEVGGEEVS